MIRVITSLDIDPSGALSRKNWLTMQQIISMRCQCEIVSEPVKIDNKYSFVFAPHHPQVYANFTDNLHYLKLDTNGVPMINTAEPNADVILLNTDNNIQYEFINYR